MTTATIAIAILLLLFVAYSAFNMHKIRRMDETADSDKIVTLTIANFEHQTKNGVVLIDFWAGWCMPCKTLAPIINEVAEEVGNDVKICKINVDEQKELESKFSVRGIPSIILLKNGKEVKRFVGVKTKDFLLKNIKKVL